MKIPTTHYAVTGSEEISLKDRPTSIAPLYASKVDYLKQLERGIEQLRKQQELLYATNQHALLIIFQAMDAAGKDSAIKHVMSGINPQGCQVYSFKHPTPEELDHDFLWRTNRRLPERGRIGIFNRSYYEEVLIAKVHPRILRAQNVPEHLSRSESIWEERYSSIRDLEAHLTRNGTRVLKFFLHLSKTEQRKRFLKRIDEPAKNWKFSSADIEERAHWDKYMDVYQDCINATSTPDAPWHVVPADDKKNSRLVISRVILEALQSLDMSYPKTTPERLRELKGLRARLEKERG
jgi:PPK2 family polyphosphate:nucleotide phosphotransferase